MAKPKLHKITGWMLGRDWLPIWRRATLVERILHRLGIIGGFNWVKF